MYRCDLTYSSRFDCFLLYVGLPLEEQEKPFDWLKPEQITGRIPADGGFIRIANNVVRFVLLLFCHSYLFHCSYSQIGECGVFDLRNKTSVSVFCRSNKYGYEFGAYELNHECACTRMSTHNLFP